MSESSDSDIIQRKRQSKIKRHYDSEEESILSDSYDVSNEIEGDFEPLFREIFGRGDEYCYIYNDLDEKVLSEADLEEINIDINECFSYISKIITGYSTICKEFTIETLKSLLDGHSIEFLAYYETKMSVNELYYIQGLVDEFKEFSLFKRTTGTNLDTLRSCKNFRVKEVPSFVTGLLNVDDYADNLINYERKHLPRTSLIFTFSNENSSILSSEDKENIKSYFHKVIFQISNNPTFIDRVYRCYESQLVDKELYNPESTSSLYFLQNLYVSDMRDIHDLARRYIIELAYNMVDVNRNASEKSLGSYGLIDVEDGLCELTDIIISLQGRDKRIGAAYYDKGLIYGVIVDSMGEIEVAKTFKECFVSEIRSFFSDFTSVLISSTSQNIKFILQNFQINFHYVPRKLSFFNDKNEFSIPYNIALAVQSPVLYFSKVWYAIKNGDKILNFKCKNLTILERAIKIACSVHKIDWTFCYNHKFGYIFYKLMNIVLDRKYFNYESLHSLDSLREVFSTIRFSNICTYFNLLDSRNSLDKSFVHPDFYSIAHIVCKVTYHKLVILKHDCVMNKLNLSISTDNYEISDIFVSNPDYLKIVSMGLTDEPRDDVEKVEIVKRILERTNEPYFSGASDYQIFSDVVPRLENKIYIGTIMHAGPDFYIINVENASVYVKKIGEYSINQIVNVEIQGSVSYMLSYNGCIIESLNNVTEMFKTHSLYRNMNQSSIEKYMNNNGFNILIRPSSQEGACVVVCKIFDDLFYTFKLTEIVESGDTQNTCYLYSNINYKTINHFIDSYISVFYNLINDIIKFKYFYKTEDEALQYVEAPGQFIKYCIYFSRKYPGFIEILIGGKKSFIKIEDKNLVFNKMRFSRIEDVIGYIKSITKTV